MAETVLFTLQYIYHPTHREKDEAIYKKFPTGWASSLREQVTLRVYEEEFWGPPETVEEMMAYIRGVYEDLKERKIIGEFRITVA
jgi:hypothetical protein